MQYYQASTPRLLGKDLRLIQKEAEAIFHRIERRSRRIPYVRSRYFHNQKVFLTLYWVHLRAKSRNDRLRRLRFYPSALELIRKTQSSPESKQNPNNRDEILHRFGGKTPTGEVFYVQVKEEKRTGRKYLLSTFPG